MFVFASSRSLFAESQTPWNKLNYKHFQTKTKCLKCFQNSLWQHRWCSWSPQQTRLSPQPPGKGKVVILSTFYLFLLSKKCFTCCMYLNIIFLLDASTCLIKPTKRLRALSVLLFFMFCHLFLVTGQWHQERICFCFYPSPFMSSLQLAYCTIDAAIQWRDSG